MDDAQPREDDEHRELEAAVDRVVGSTRRRLAIAVVLFVGGFGAAVVSVRGLTQQRATLQRDVRQLQARRTVEQRQVDALQAQHAEAQRSLDEIRSQLAQSQEQTRLQAARARDLGRAADNYRVVLASTAARPSPHPQIDPAEVQRVLDETRTAGYVIAFYSLGLDQTGYDSLRGWLEQQGLHVDLTHSARIEDSNTFQTTHHVPEWFTSAESKVLWYHRSAEPVARELAERLSERTGVQFVADQGAGHVPALDADQLRWYLIVHYRR